MEPVPSPVPPDAVVVALGAALYPEKQALQVRASPHVAPELISDLRSAGIKIGPVPLASVAPDQLAVFAAITGGSLTGLAAVLRVFLSRHQHRAVMFEQDGTRYDLRGMSQRDVEATLDRILAGAAARQIENDELWDQAMLPNARAVDPPEAH